jgi:hypothetical protein
VDKAFGDLCQTAPFSFCITQFVLLAEAGRNTYTTFSDMPAIVENSILALVIFFVALGLGWAGKRLLGKEGILENTAASVKLNAEATAQIGGLIDKHDQRQSSHHDLCSESNKGVKILHGAALVACDQLEEACRENKIEVGDRISKVRQALRDSWSK